MEPVTVLVADKESGAALPKGFETILRATRDIEAACDAKRLFVVVSATTLPQVAECVSHAAKLHRLYGLFVRNDMGREWAAQIFERASLRRIRNSLIHSDPRVGQRILKAAAMGAGTHFIADATVAGDRIFAMDCAFNLYEMPFNAYPALQRIPPGARGSFEIVLDGAYLHWGDQDVDLDLESIRLVTNPERRLAAERERILTDRALGAAVKALREERGLRQSDILGLSERQVRRIEKGAEATVAAIDALSRAHGMDADAYLEEIGARIFTLDSH